MRFTRSRDLLSSRGLLNGSWCTLFCALGLPLRLNPAVGKVYRWPKAFAMFCSRFRWPNITSGPGRHSMRHSHKISCFILLVSV